MQGSSRGSQAEAERAFAAALDAGADPATLAEDLFGVVAVLDGSAALRRAFGDPSRKGPARQALVEQLCGGKISDPAMGLVKGLVASRWSEDRDLTDTGEQLAVGAVIATAEKAGRADQVEDELFRFERIVAGNPALRDALGDRRGTGAERAKLVESLLGGKTAPETMRLARQAVQSPRGRRFDRVMAQYQSIAETRREQLAATVTSAVPLDASQRDRLAAALSNHYGKTVHLNTLVDDSVVGGIRVQVGDDVVDGTILRRLEEARRRLGA